jgi:hypothetical protein
MKLKKSSLEKEPFENQSKITVRMNYLLSLNIAVVIIVLSWRRGDHFICVK